MKTISKRYFVFFIVFFCFFPLASKAQQKTAVDLKISARQVETGENFNVSVVVKGVSLSDLNLGNFSIPGLENFQIIGSSDSTRVQILNGVGMAVWERVLNIQAIKTGDFKLGPVVLTYKNRNKKIIQIKSNQVEVKVIDKKKFFHTKNKEKTDKKTSFGIFTVIKNIFMLLLLVVLVFLLYQRERGIAFDFRFPRRRKRRKKQSKEEKTELLVNKIDVPNLVDDDFYIKLKKNILDFIARRYGCDVKAKTTAEILAKLKEPNPTLREELKQILAICDYAQYAQVENNREQAITLINNINKHFI